VHVRDEVPEAGVVEARGLDHPPHRGRDTRDVLPQTELAIERDIVEPIGVIAQEEDAVAAIALLVGEDDVRLGEGRDELRIGAAGDTLDSVTGGARQPARWSQRAVSAGAPG